MKTRFFIIISAALVIPLLLLLIIASRSEDPPEYMRFIPHDADGVLVVRDLPESIESLKETRLAGWIDFEVSVESNNERENQLRQAAALYRENARHLVLCLHSIQQKDNKSLRPELTLFIQPRTGRLQPLAGALTDFVAARFGEEGVEIDTSGNRIRVTGPEKGQVFHLETCGSYLAASNSNLAWDRFQKIRELDPETVLMPSWYALMTDNSSADICLYFRGIADLIPRFVYSIAVEDGIVTDDYREF